MMKELSLHILDIAENSVSANAKTVSIEVEENSKKNLLSIIITDDGKGMDVDMLAKVTDPFTTTRTTRKVGLGIPFLKEAAEACNGHLTIESIPNKGTRLEATFQLDHIDRMPMGSIETTFLNLLIGFPDVHWKFKYKIDEKEFFFDSEPIRKALNGIPYTDPIVLSYLRELIENGIQRVQSVHNEV